MDASITKQSLGEQIAEQIRRGIWEKEIQFGERLIESDLSEKFDVSRNAIRDAFTILEYEELIYSKPRKGTYVTEFTKDDWQEIIDLRFILESYAFVRALPYLKVDDFKALTSIIKQMEHEAEEKNWSELFDLDMRFHRYVVNKSNHSRIIKIYNSVQMQIRTFFTNLDQYYSSPTVFYNEQKDLYEALLTKDTEVVRSQIEMHIAYVEGQFLGL